MNIKQPFVADISHWKEVADFKAITPRPYLMITKASEGVAFVDSKFIRFFAGMKEAGMLRGCYHFNRKAHDGALQALHFIDVVQSHIDDDTLLVLDVEEGGEGAAELKEWFDVVRSRFPNNRVLLYSRRNILEQITMTAAQKTYFRLIPTWVAGYPYNPDQYSEVPLFYIADPTRFGPPWLWQYSEKGQVEGIVGDVDLNWISPIFTTILGAPAEPPEIEEPMADITLTADLKTGNTSNLRTAAGLNATILLTLAGPLSIQGVGQKIQRDGYYWIQIVAPYAGWVALTTSYENVVIVPPTEPGVYLPSVLYIGMKPDGSDAEEYRKVA